MKYSIHLFHKLPTPYNDFLFQQLAKDERLLLKVYHLWKKSPSRPWQAQLGLGYTNTYLNTRISGIDWKLLRIALLDRDAFFIIGDWAHTASIVLLIARILIKAPVSIWADTPQEHLKRPWLKRIPRKAFLSWLLPKMDIVFGTGKPGRKTLIDMGVPSERIVNLPCYVNLDLPVGDLTPEKKLDIFSSLGIDSNAIPKVVFLMSGMCTYKKGQDIGIKAFSEYVKASDIDTLLLIAGDGSDRDNLEELARRLGVSDKIKFLGWLEPDNMQKALQVSDVLIHSARWDPFPLVVLEAMSWGKVVIGSDVCGSVEDRIIHGSNGFSFPTGDVSHLTALIKLVAEDGALRKRIGSEARKTAEEWPIERGVQTIVQTTQKVLEDHSSKT